MATLDYRLLPKRDEPAQTRLAKALGRLSSTLTVMNTGAHPDDEHSGLLAYLRFGLGMRTVIACSTRGEGGQNVLGSERGAALGVLRTREMEEAARVLDADLVWLGHGPDDPVHDFGFSKNGEDTLARWGRERILERLVRAYREEKPDIVIPTFLDVPGQHGHHRAMTWAAREAVRLAADTSAFPEHLEKGLRPWRVAKLYLPAWSGGGGTYDDEEPPPEATLEVEAPGKDPISGDAFDLIGERSRAFHASQGMGVWKDHWRSRWSLHLVGGGTEDSITDGFSVTIGDLADEDGVSFEAQFLLLGAQTNIDDAISAAPNGQAVARELVSAARLLEDASRSVTKDFLDLHGHRIAAKLKEIEAALFDAAGISVSASVLPAIIGGGAAANLAIKAMGGDDFAADLQLDVVSPAGVSATLAYPEPDHQPYFLNATAGAPPTDPFPPRWSRIGANGAFKISVAAMIAGRAVQRSFDLTKPVAVVPGRSIRLEPDRIVLAPSNERRSLIVEADADLKFETPSGLDMFWARRHRAAEPDETADASAARSWELIIPAGLPVGRYSVVPTIGGKPAVRRVEFAYPHIGEAAIALPRSLEVLLLDVNLPDARIGYIDGGADNVGTWLQRMGLNVKVLSSAATDFSRFDTIVVGIFAFGIRNDLRLATGRLHDFVQRGGHLVTLYHRPSDNWEPRKTPPRRLEIGSPSLRWRVTDPAAEVTVLLPEHPLLTGPNIIGPDDWAGWDKERGLYFASRWSDAYVPLLAMHDAGEPPLNGALVSARIGDGRHTHVSLVLHHQMDKMVPGAFRLMANLVQKAR